MKSVVRVERVLQEVLESVCEGITRNVERGCWLECVRVLQGMLRGC